MINNNNNVQDTKGSRDDKVSKAERFTIKILTPVSGGSDQNSCSCALTVNQKL